MPINPKVTVLMSVYNGECYLNEAIDSILTQTFTNFEFLIIDDASTDGTPQILRNCADSRIRIITNEENLGLTKSLNKGLALARGVYIARMDADDISLPERLEQQVVFLDSHPCAALVGTSCQIIDQKGNSLERCFVPSESVSYNDLIKQNCINHGSVLVRREVMEALHYYDELFKKCQDYALWLQMAKQYQLNNIPNILYKLRIHPNSVSREGNESIYYRILAIRVAENSIPEGLIEEISTSDIKCLSKHFTKNEWICYHNFMAAKHRMDSNLKCAYQEYWKLFKVGPTNIFALINALRMYLKSKVVYIPLAI